MYHRKLEGEQNHLSVQGHQAPRASLVSWSTPGGVFVALACNLALFSWENGRACRSRALAINQRYTVPSHELSREVGPVCNIPQRRATSSHGGLCFSSNSRISRWPRSGSKLFLWSKDSNLRPGHELHKCYRQNVSHLYCVIKTPMASWM